MASDPTDCGAFLIDLVAGALEPLEIAAGDPSAAAALINLTGWDFGTVAGLGPTELMTSSTNIATALSAVRDAFSKNPQGEANSQHLATPDISSLAKALASITEAGASLYRLGDSWTPPLDLSPDLPGRFIEDLLGHLAVLAAARYHPLIRSVLELSGILIYVDAAAVTRSNGQVIRPAGRCPRLDLAALSRLLTDPAKALLERFGLSGVNRLPAIEAADLVFPALAAVLRDVGLVAWYGDPGTSAVALTPEERKILAHTLRVTWPHQLENRGGVAVLDLAFALRDDGPNRELLVMPSGSLSYKLSEATWQAQAGISGQVGAAVIRADGVRFTDLGAQVKFEIGFDRPAQSIPLARLGSATGHRLEIGGAKVATFVELGVSSSPSEASPLPNIEAAVQFELKGLLLVAGASPGDGFLSTQLPAEGLKASCDLGVIWTASQGLRFSGSTALELKKTLNLRLGPVSLDTFHMAVQTLPQGASLETSVSATLRLGPVTAAVERFGLLGMVTPGSEDRPGAVNLKIAFKPPKGVALSIDAGVVVGGGFLFFDKDTQQYGGMVHLEIAESLNLNAIGLITTRLPDGSPGFSMLVLIAVEFAPPIQLGYGFALKGIGGILGINRTVAVEVLRSGLRAGTLGSILLPHDPMANAPKIISDLNTVFPPAEGRFVFGPMILLAWGPNNLIQLQIGLVLELPAPVRLFILGQLRVLLPDEEHPMVKLQLDALGVIDFGNGDISLDAVLYDSEIKGFVITGEMALRANVGATPGFVLAVGGFHPAFPAPAGFPALKRVTISLATGDNPRLRLAAYLALTTNTVQFGASLDFLLKIAAFSVEGRFAFDALIQFTPFGLAASMAAMVAVKAGTTVLLAVSLDLSLTGPTPWHIWGKAHFQILFISVTVDFDATIGQAEPPPLPPPVDIRPLLVAALEEPRNWGTQLPAGEHALVVVREQQDQDLLVHPLADLHVTQQVVPLGQVITRFGTTRPEPNMPDGTTKFTLTLSSSQGMFVTKPLEAAFPRAQFQAMSDEEKLAAPAFDSFESGLRFLVPGFVCGDPVLEEEIEYEEKILVRDPQDKTIATSLVSSAAPYALAYQLVQQVSAIGAVGQATLYHSGRTKYQEDTLKPGTLHELRRRKEAQDFGVIPRLYKVVSLDKKEGSGPDKQIFGKSYTEAKAFVDKGRREIPWRKPRLRVIPDLIEVGRE